MRKAFLVVVLVGAAFGAGYLASRDAATASPVAPAAPAATGSSPAASGASAAAASAPAPDPWSPAGLAASASGLTFADEAAATLFNKVFTAEERRVARAASEPAMSASGADVLRLLLRAAPRARGAETEADYLHRRVTALLARTAPSAAAPSAAVSRAQSVEAAAAVGVSIPPYTEKFVWSSYRRPDGSVARVFVPAAALFFAAEANRCAADAAAPCHADASRVADAAGARKAADAFWSRDERSYREFYDAQPAARAAFLDAARGAGTGTDAGLEAAAVWAHARAFAPDAAAPVAQDFAPDVAPYALPAAGPASDFGAFVTYYWAARSPAAVFPMPADIGLNPWFPKTSK